MERRKFVIGMGALASGSAAAIGTGAFTTVEADRDVEVDVADDADAYLRLEPGAGDNGAYADDSGNTLSVDFGNLSGAGDGVNANARTEAEEVFKIGNEGTQSIGTVDLSGSGDVNVASAGTSLGSISTSEDNIYAALSSSVSNLSVGDDVNVGFVIDTGASGSDLSGGLTITAEE